MRVAARRPLLVVFVLVALAAAVPGGPAGAHPPGGAYYGFRWGLGPETPSGRGVQFFFTRSFPAFPAWRERVRDGFRAWNGLRRALVWVELPPLGDFPPTTCSLPQERNGMHLRDLTADLGEARATIGVTYVCLVGGRIHSANVVYDRAERWSTEPVVPGPQYYDAASVATHEVGHASGSGHWAAAAGICNYGMPAVHTMCPFVARGDMRLRSLQEHDAHTFAAAY